MRLRKVKNSHPRHKSGSCVTQRYSVMRLISLLLLVVALWAVGAFAVEPISISVGTVTTVIGVIGSVVSFLITALKFVVTWGLFILIVFVIGVQFIPFLQALDLVSILERFLAEAALCNPAGPESDQTDTRGNLAYRNN